MEAKVNPTQIAPPVLPIPPVPAPVSLPYSKRLSGWATFIAFLQILGPGLGMFGDYYRCDWYSLHNCRGKTT